MKPLVIVGAGGFGRETLDVVAAMNAQSDDALWDVVGVVDDAISRSNRQLLRERGTLSLGTVDEYLAKALPSFYCVGIGAPKTRRIIASKFDAKGHEAAVLIHPTATQGFGVEIGAGTVVCAGVSLTTNIKLGRHVHLNPNTTVGHDTVIGDFVSANPHTSISGDCVIEDEVLIGVAAAVLNRLTVGHGSIVGASACVVRNVPPGVVVKGVPAR